MENFFDFTIKSQLWYETFREFSRVPNNFYDIWKEKENFFSLKVKHAVFTFNCNFKNKILFLYISTCVWKTIAIYGSCMFLKETEFRFWIFNQKLINSSGREFYILKTMLNFNLQNFMKLELWTFGIKI